MELKKKGTRAELGSFSQLKVALAWTAAVDLDLMAFYKAKDGRVGGVYSPNYAGGSLGDLNGFPFIALSGDAGVGGAAGENREELRISKLDDLAELWVCAINFTDASADTGRPFAEYDARVEVLSDQGDRHDIALDSTGAGPVAVIARFESSFMGAAIQNQSEVMAFGAFKEAAPGAGTLQLSSKIVLKKKGESAPLVGRDFHATMRWKSAVDLDLHCFYRLKDSALEQPQKKKGFLGKLVGGGAPSQSGRVYFGSRGAKDKAPWISLDKDAGIGDRGGDNEENLYLTAIDKVEHALIVANIFNKPNANFASYDGLVLVRGGEREVEVPLDDTTPGSWCVIARIDNSGAGPRLVNVNDVRKDKPTIDQYLG